MKKKEKCWYCGQVVDRKIWLANVKKIARANGMPSLAKLITMLPEK